MAKKKLISFILAMLMVLTVIPMAAISASAAGITYAVKQFSDTAAATENYGYWNFVYDSSDQWGNKIYYIKNSGSNLYLSYRNSAVITDGYQGDNAQKWFVRDYYGGVSLTNVNSYTDLEIGGTISGSATGFTVRLGVWQKGVTPNWVTNGSDTTNSTLAANIQQNTDYMIGNYNWSGNYMGSDYYLAYAAKLVNNYTEAAIIGNWQFTNKETDQWGNLIFKMKNPTTGLYLTYKNDQLMATPNVDNDSTQKWYVRDWYGYVYITNVSAYLNLKVGGSVGLTSSSEVQQLALWTANAAPAWGDGNGNASTNITVTNPSQIVENTEYIVGNLQWEGNFLGIDISNMKDLAADITAPTSFVNDKVNLGTEFGYWKFEFYNSAFRIKNTATGLYLTDNGSSAPVQQSLTNGNLNQLWTATVVYGWLNLKNIKTGRNLLVTNGVSMSNDGQTLAIFEKGVTPNYNGAGSSTNGIISMTNVSAEKEYAIALGTWDGHYLGADYAPAVIPTYEVTYHTSAAAENNTAWNIEKQTSGAYRIKNATTGLYLADIAGKIVQQGYNATSKAQLWSFINRGTNQFIPQNLSTKSYLLISGGISASDWGTVQYQPVKLTDIATGLDVALADVVSTANYTISNSPYTGHFLGGVIPTVEFTGISPMGTGENAGTFNLTMGKAATFKAKDSNGNGTSYTVTSGSSVNVTEQIDGSLYIVPVSIGQTVVKLVSKANTSIVYDLTVNVTVISGDYNASGDVTILDVVGARNVVIGKVDLSDISILDMNSDGKVDILDLLYLKDAVLSNVIAVNETTEIALTSSRMYENPYTEVSVNAVFSGPEGESLTVPAYWDGGTSWRVRFSPTCEGTWTYVTNSTNSADVGLTGKTGSFNAVGYNGTNNLIQHGRLRVSDTNEYLTYADGTPFFWLADTHWFGMSSRESLNSSSSASYDSQFKAIVDDRAEQGYTAYQTVFWLSNDWDTLGLGNEGGRQWIDNNAYVDLNPEYWHYVDLRIQYLLSKGIAPVIGFDWGGKLYQENMQDYQRIVRYVIGRYSSYPVIWFLAGEYNTTSSTDLTKMFNSYDTLGNFVDATDPYANLTTIHGYNSSNTANGTSDYYSGKPWFDFVMNEGGHATSFNAFNYWNTLEAEPTVPWLEAEAKYEDIWGIPTEQTREIAYLSIMNGSFGYSYGAEGLWNATQNPEDRYQVAEGYTPIPWYDALVKPVGSQQMTYLKNLFTAVPWWKLNSTTSKVTWNGLTGNNLDILKPTVKAASDNSCVMIYYPMTNNAQTNLSYYYNVSGGTMTGLNPNTTYTAKFYQTETGLWITQSASVTCDANGNYTLPIPADLATADYMFVLADNNAVIADPKLSETIAPVGTKGETSLFPAYLVDLNAQKISLDTVSGVQGTNNFYYKSYNIDFEEYADMSLYGSQNSWGQYCWTSAAEATNLDGLAWVANDRMCGSSSDKAVITWVAPSGGTITIISRPTWIQTYSQTSLKEGATFTLTHNSTTLSSLDLRPQSGCEKGLITQTINVNSGDTISFTVGTLGGYNIMCNQVELNTDMYFSAN